MLLSKSKTKYNTAIGLMFFWTSYFMSLSVLYMISVFRKLTVNLCT